MGARALGAIGTSLAALVVVGLTIAAASRATSPATNGRVAFQRYLFKDTPLQADIFVANSGGGGQRRVTTAPRGLIDGEPDWSPDGKQIAFQRGPTVDGPWTLWVVNADGTGASRLSPVRGRCLDESSPAFSPDRKQIAFECHNHTRHGELFIANVDGSGLRLHPDGTGLRRLTDFSPATGLLQNGSFSPDGTSVSFATTDHATRTRRSDLPDVFTVRIDGTHIKPVTHEKNWDGSPDWGPP